MATRHHTYEVYVGGVKIGANNPIVVQSMTDTPTEDVDLTVEQVKSLALAGSEIVRLTVNNDKAAAAVTKIKEKLLQQGFNTPLVGCFHYNGHQLLKDHPECALALDKYRINPGNVGFGKKRDPQFEMMVECALKYQKPVRIGVNWGSLDQQVLADLMDQNSRAKEPKESSEILREALIKSALDSAVKAQHIGLGADKIILSVKVSDVQELVLLYRELAKRSNYALHLGLTEAGMGMKGMVATSIALGILLNEGIGDTIRSSITPKPGQSRTDEVRLCCEVLQSMGFRSFMPQVSSCPGCGRTTSTFFRELADDIQNYVIERRPIWQKQYPRSADLKIAVMGCIVNGPGESKHANIGISLPGSGEAPVAPVFIDGEKAHTLRGDNIAQEFKEILEQYVIRNYT